MVNIQYLESLKHSWSAEVMLQNDLIITIWYTALPMRKDSIKKVVSVSSDYPKHELCKSN